MSRQTATFDGDDQPATFEVDDGQATFEVDDGQATFNSDDRATFDSDDRATFARDDRPPPAVPPTRGEDVLCASHDQARPRRDRSLVPDCLPEA